MAVAKGCEETSDECTLMHTYTTLPAARVKVGANRTSTQELLFHNETLDLLRGISAVGSCEGVGGGQSWEPKNEPTSKGAGARKNDLEVRLQPWSRCARAARKKKAKAPFNMPAL